MLQTNKQTNTRGRAAAMVRYDVIGKPKKTRQQKKKKKVEAGHVSFKARLNDFNHRVIARCMVSNRPRMHTLVESLFIKSNI